MLRGADVFVAVSRFFSQRCDWLALRFNCDRHLSDEVRRNLHLHLVRDELLQRFIKENVVLLHGDPTALARVSDLLVRDGAEELPALADLHPHGECGAADVLGVLLRLLLDAINLGGP
jgi:hypothetical protein